MKRVLVLGREVKVNFISQAEMDQITGDLSCFGVFHENAIFIVETLSKEMQQRTLLHEMAHVIFEATGLKYLLGEKKEDAICNSFECLLDAFQDEDLAKFLSK